MNDTYMKIGIGIIAVAALLYIYALLFDIDADYEINVHKKAKLEKRTSILTLVGVILAIIGYVFIFMS